MDYKFCMKCGYKMPKEAMFCPKCGTEQVMVKQGYTSNSNRNKSEREPVHYDMSVVPPSGGYDDNKIMAFEHSMGFKADKDDFIVATKGSMALRGGLGSLISPIAGELALASVKWFVVCFKDDGVLLLGLNFVGHLTRNVMFIPKHDIAQIGISYGHTFNIVTKEDQKMTFHNKFLVGYQRWHHIYNNRKNLSKLVAKEQ